MKQFGKDLKAEIAEDRITAGAAALAYYLMLAIFPAMIALLSLIPYLPIENIDQAVMDLLRQGLPGETADMFTGTVTEVTTNRKGGLLSIGLLVTLWAASNGMFAVMQQLNVAYGAREERPFWKARGTAVVLTLLMGALIVTSFGLIVAGGHLQAFLASRLGWGGLLTTAFQAVRWAVIACFLLLAFAVSYAFGPDVRSRFRFISPGAVVGCLLLVAASLGFKLYVENFGKYGATYGSIGAIIVLMLWLNIGGLVLLLGAEVNALADRYRGAPIARTGGRRRQVMPEFQNTSPRENPPKTAPVEAVSEPESAPESGSLGSVLKEVGMSMKDLVQSEIHLVKAEMKESSRYAARHLTQAALFGVLAAISILPFLAFCVIGLGRLLDGRYWLSSLIVALVCVAIGAPMAIRASKKIKEEDMRFDHARGGIDRGREAIQEGIQEVKDAAGRRAA